MMAGPIGLETWWDDRGHVGERPRQGKRLDDPRLMILTPYSRSKGMSTNDQL